MSGHTTFTLFKVGSGMSQAWRALGFTYDKTVNYEQIQPSSHLVGNYVSTVDLSFLQLIIKHLKSSFLRRWRKKMFIVVL